MTRSAVRLVRNRPTIWVFAARIRHLLNRSVFFATGAVAAGVVSTPSILSNVSFLGYSTTAYLAAGLTILIIVTLLVDFTIGVWDSKASLEPEAVARYRAKNPLLRTAGATAAGFALFQVTQSTSSLDNPKAIQAVVAYWLLLGATIYLTMVRRELNPLIITLIWSGAVGAVLIIADSAFSWSIFGGRTSAMYLLLPLALSLYRVFSPPTQWALSLGIFSAISVTASRTATVTALIIFLTYVLMTRGTRLPQRILLFASSVALFSAFLVFNPTVQDRFLDEPGDQAISIEMPFGPANIGLEGAGTNHHVINLNTNGRFTVWSALAQKAVLNHPIIGGGSGYSNQFVAEQFGWNHPHNEFIRIFVDFGAIGSILFLVALGSLGLFFIRHLKREREPAFLGIVALISVALFSVTEGPLISLGFVLPFSIVVSVAIRGLVVPIEKGRS